MYNIKWVRGCAVCSQIVWQFESWVKDRVVTNTTGNKRAMIKSNHL